MNPETIEYPENIPQVVYAELTPENREDLQTMIKRFCKSKAAELSLWSYRRMDFDESYNDLLYEALILISQAEAGRYSEVTNWGGYLVGAVKLAAKKMWIKFKEDREFERTLIESAERGIDLHLNASANSYVRVKEIDEAAKKVAPHIELIERCAKKLNQKFNENDLVTAAIRIILSPHRKDKKTRPSKWGTGKIVSIGYRWINAEDNAKLDELHRAFIKSGHIKPGEHRFKHLADHIEDILREDPDLTWKQVESKLLDMGIEAKSVRQRYPVVRKKLGISGKPGYNTKSTPLREVRKLWKEGVRELEDIIENFKHRSIPYKETLIRKALWQIKTGRDPEIKYTGEENGN